MTKPTNLANALFAELFQTERSAVRHSAIEADRLGDSPPAVALRAVASHASRAEIGLKEHAARRGVEARRVGTAVGALFSTVRDTLADFTLNSEESYRGTLLGIRHGCDVVALVGSAAEIEGDVKLTEWCAEWLAERRSLVDDCARALSWFASHPERALRNAKTKAA